MEGDEIEASTRVGALMKVLDEDTELICELDGQPAPIVGVNFHLTQNTLTVKVETPPHRR